MNPPRCEPAVSGASDRERPGVQDRRSSPADQPRDPVARAVLVSLETALSRIRSTEADARRGDVEGIHRLRTTTRRLRSELRAFRDLVAPDWIGPLEGEMKWLAGLLGDVRDLDVLIGPVPQGCRGGRLADSSRWHLCSADLMSRHAPRLARAARGPARGPLSRPARRPPASDRPSVARQSGSCTPCRDGVAAARRRDLAAAQEVRPAHCGRPIRRGLPRGPQARQAGSLHGRDGRPRPVRGRRQGRRAGSSGARPGSRTCSASTRMPSSPGTRSPGCSSGMPDGPRISSGPPAVCSTARPKPPGSAREAFFDAWDKLDRKKSRRWLCRASQG